MIMVRKIALTDGYYEAQVHHFVCQKHMNHSQPKNPLHGVTLKAILEYLVAEYGWEKLGERINIQCFNNEPSINSSLKFLRKTAWAREKVETLYVYSISYDQRHGRNKDAVDKKPIGPGDIWDQILRKE